MEICNILQFKPKCSHKSIEYDNHTREMFCSKCKKKLDPVNTIKRVFQQMRNFKQQLDNYAKEIVIFEKRKRIKCKKCGHFTRLKL